MSDFIYLENTTSTAIPDEQKIRHWAILALTQGQQHPAEISIKVVTPDDIQQLNRQFRQQNKPTNVIAFPFEDTMNTDSTYLGDIAICANIVANEAQAQHKTFDAHFAHMVIHGILHLMGYDHQNDIEAHQMESLEIELLTQLGFANPYGAE